MLQLGLSPRRSDTGLREASRQEFFPDGLPLGILRSEQPLGQRTESRRRTIQVVPRARNRRPATREVGQQKRIRAKHENDREITSSTSTTAKSDNMIGQ
jgi:hypothetical protein